MERKVCPGEIYRHFKGELYQIITVACHYETRESMVVYQALYGDFQVYVRPYDQFLSLVDEKRYPNASQQYRFEKIERAAKFSGEKEGGSGVTIVEEREEKPVLALLGFLDAENLEEKISYLKKWRDTVSQSDLDSIYVALDMKPQTGNVQEQLDGVIQYLSIQRHYDGRRLR